MVRLLDVFGEFFRAFGYQPLPSSAPAIGLVLAKDNRRWGVIPHLDGRPLTAADLDAAAQETAAQGLDGSLLLSLGETGDDLVVRGAGQGLRVWDARRLCLELGSAVLRETVPEHWSQQDPLAASRPSKILERIQQHAGQQAAAAPVPAPAPAAPEPTPALPPLATTPVPETLQVPPAFGIFDQFETPAPAAAPPAAAPTAAPIIVPVVNVAAPPGPPARAVLRLRVDRELAGNLARPKTRTVDRQFLRLVPYHVFDYEATLLIEGTVKAERKTGRIAVHAVRKEVAAWDRELDIAPLDVAADIDERPIKIEPEPAGKLLREHVRGLMTRDVTMEEDESEWSVVVKKKVELADDALNLHHLGVHWVPVWRVTGKWGSVEIDGSTGQVVHEEIMKENNDAVLL